MKIAIDLDQLSTERPVKDRLISIRVTAEAYKTLKDYNPNVSQTIRALIEQFVVELEKESHSWTRRKL